MNRPITLADLCIVILESPYHTLTLKESREAFANLMDMKIQGYLAVHDNGALPLDTTDFLATHVFVSNKQKPLDEIYMCYKSTTFRICESFNIPFPFTSILKNHAKPECHEEMERIISECRLKGQDLAYDTGWTIAPIVREHKELQQILKELISLFAIYQHREYSISHWVTLGICKVKTDQHFLRMGLKEISGQPIISHPYLHNTDARAVISMDGNYADFVHFEARKYLDLWNNRLIISHDQAKQKKKAA